MYSCTNGLLRVQEDQPVRPRARVDVGKDTVAALGQALEVFVEARLGHFQSD